MVKRKLVGKGVKSPKKTPEEKIRDTDVALNNIKKNRKKSTKKEKTEELTEMEREFLSKMFQAFLKQYPLKTKGKNPDRYAPNHRMGVLLEKKLIRMKLLMEREK